LQSLAYMAVLLVASPAAAAARSWQELPALAVPDHHYTQEQTMDHLRELWGIDTARVMVDIGAMLSLHEHGQSDSYNEGDTTFWRRRGFHGRVMAVEINPLFANHIRRRHETLFAAGERGARGETRLIVANVRLGAKDTATKRVKFTPGVDVPGWLVKTGWPRTGMAMDFVELVHMPRKKQGCIMPKFAKLELAGVDTVCHDIIPLLFNTSVRWRVPMRRWETLWETELQRATVDFMKVDFDPGWRLFSKMMSPGGSWHTFLSSHAVKVMSFELDEMPYWNNMWSGFLPRFAAFGYAVLLKWPCAKDEYSSLLVPLEQYGTPNSTEITALLKFRKLSDVLIVDRQERGLLEHLVRRAAEDCKVPSLADQWAVRGDDGGWLGRIARFFG